jgi:GT2 family glycosyltransferase
MVSYMTGPALLQSIRAVLADRDIYELIIVDNGNTLSARHDLSQVIIPSDKIRLLQGHGNIGFARGCNYGAKLASGDCFLFLNPDAIISDGAARRMSDCGLGLKQPWLVGGMLRDINGKEQRGGRRRALTPLSAFVTFTGLAKLPVFKSIHMENEPLPLGPEPVPVVSGACVMMDRQSFEVLGGFDERYFLHVEDIDLCRRAQKHGGDVYFIPSATVKHYGSTSDVVRWKIEWEKLKGFIIYFWRYSDHWWFKACVALSIPAMTLAIMGRAGWLTLRAALTGR